MKRKITASSKIVVSPQLTRFVDELQNEGYIEDAYQCYWGYDAHGNTVLITHDWANDDMILTDISFSQPEAIGRDEIHRYLK